MSINAKRTQEFVPIKEIRDGVIVLKNGDLRAIVMANSINLSLKSEEEQKAIIFQFQSFLNTLDFPIQISAQSRRLDIKPYLLLLEEKMKIQSETLLKLQTKEYIEFIKNFTESVSIMTKSFFIVIPYTNNTLQFKKGTDIFSKIFNRRNKEEEQKEKEEDFEEKRSQLEERISVIEQGLSRCDVKSIQLGTEEIVELFYKIFNPGDVESKINIK